MDVLREDEHSLTYEEYYEQMRSDSPEKDELTIRKNALTAANLDMALVARRKQLGAVRLVPASQPGGFVNALFGAVDTTGRMPVVRPEREEEVM